MHWMFYEGDESIRQASMLFRGDCRTMVKNCFSPKYDYNCLYDTICFIWTSLLLIIDSSNVDRNACLGSSWWLYIYSKNIEIDCVSTIHFNILWLLLVENLLCNFFSLSIIITKMVGRKWTIEFGIISLRGNIYKFRFILCHNLLYSNGCLTYC